VARFTIRPRAWRALNQIADDLEERAGLETAVRFFTSALQTFGELADTPRMGHRCNFKRPSLRRLRRWPVKGFENWAIFYRVKRDGVEIVHVIHGARDIEGLLGERD
jgi:toxin ParE1/3/4